MKKMLLAAVAAFAIAAPASAAPIFWAGNGHYYEYVGTSTTWAQARSAALASEHLGHQGYLVTITSQAERDFIYSSVTGATVWAGGTDAVTEGTWVWADGPEAGTAFWQSGVGTVTYASWAGGEPNNLGDEDALHIHFSGVNWNDVSAGAGYGYLVEYGGLNGAVPEPSAWALLILGFGAVGGALRRNRKTRAAPIYA